MTEIKIGYMGKIHKVVIEGEQADTEVFMKLFDDYIKSLRQRLGNKEFTRSELKDYIVKEHGKVSSLDLYEDIHL
jgi:hypothetical protein